MSIFTQKFKKGTHLKSSRGLYTHHGIYIGGNKVIHYSGWADGLTAGKVEITTLDKFSQGNDVEVVQHRNPKFKCSEVIKRAKSRLNEDAYSVFNNNCEHFVFWCITGEAKSKQVELLTNIVVGIGAVFNHSIGVAGIIAKELQKGYARRIAN